MKAREHPVLFFFALYAVLSAVVAWLIARYLAWHWLVSWFAACNLVVLPMWAWDKMQAKRGRSRIPEVALHLCALTGATPASFAAMHWLRHKTLKPTFRLLYGVFVLLQVAAIAYWLGRTKGG